MMIKYSIVLVFLLLGLINYAAAVEPTVAFISMGDKGPFTQPAQDFAEEKLNATMLDRKEISFANFSKYAVVWWHDGDSDPGALTDQEIGVFLDYAEAGGAILLSAWAIRYATPMGLEDAEARQFGPMDTDGVNVGITLRPDMEKLPLWENLKNIDGDPPKAGDRVQVNSTGYPKSGDYYDKIWKNFITVADVWGPPTDDWMDRIAAFGYWEAGKGKVFNMNWRLPNFHKNNEDIDMLEMLTTNLINWLGEESLFFAVNSSGKLSATWGDIRK